MYSKSLFVAITLVSLGHAFIIENLLPHKFSLCICIGHECVMIHTHTFARRHARTRENIHIWKEEEQTVRNMLFALYSGTRINGIAGAIRLTNVMNSGKYFKCMEHFWFCFALFFSLFWAHRMSCMTSIKHIILAHNTN